MIAAPAGIGPDRPLRVHVVGNSAAVMVEPEHGPRDGGTFGEQLPGVLAARGVPCIVTNSGTWMSRINEHLPRYETDIRNHFPDVLVINFGMLEAQPAVLPLRLARHVLTWERSSRPLALRYREHVVPPLWRGLRRFQRWASAHDGGRTHRLGPQRFATDVRRLVDLVRKDCGALVLVLDIDPAGERVEHWLPTTGERVRSYNRILAEVTASYDEHVRLVRAGAAISDPATELPDGLHRSSAAHGVTARLLADEIRSWLAS